MRAMQLRASLGGAVGVLAGAGVVLFYVHGHAEQASLPTLAVPPAISINAAMVGLVDHASHAIWDTGIEGQAPQTDRDWETIAHYAIQLATAGTWITLGGTGPEERVCQP